MAETFYCFDPSGNVSQRLDGSGNLLSSHLFDAFGTFWSTASTTADPFSGYGGQDGYVTDWETGLQLCGNLPCNYSALDLWAERVAQEDVFEGR